MGSWSFTHLSQLCRSGRETRTHPVFGTPAVLTEFEGGDTESETRPTEPPVGQTLQATGSSCELLTGLHLCSYPGLDASILDTCWSLGRTPSCRELNFPKCDS